MGLGLRVQGLGFRILNLGFRFKGSGSRVEGFYVFRCRARDQRVGFRCYI
jgi:hypothetical protein